MTFDPSGADAFPAGSTVDAEMQWRVDFDTAEKVGMVLGCEIAIEEIRL